MTENQDFYKDLIDNLYDGVYFVDRERVITYWNKGAERITGYSAQRVMGHSCQDHLLNHVTAEGVELCKRQCPLAACLMDGRAREAEVFLHHADGYRLPVQVRIAPIRDSEGNILGAVETFSDNTRTLTDRKQIRELRRAAYTDRLTGIENRSHLEGRLRAAAVEYENRTESVGVLFMDIDHFKRVNDTYGHETGDLVLRMVATTLRRNLRATDVVGRWGGEEFLALVYEMDSQKALRTLAEKIRGLVEFSRLDLEPGHLYVSVSMGATLWLPEDTPESVVRRADALMYQSKGEGRNRVTVG